MSEAWHCAQLAADVGPVVVCEREELQRRITQLEEALGEVVDWLGAPDWTGPQLPVGLARRIAAVLANKET